MFIKCVTVSESQHWRFLCSQVVRKGPLEQSPPDSVQSETCAGSQIFARFSGWSSVPPNAVDLCEACLQATYAKSYQENVPQKSEVRVS